jgi:fructose-specific phosphotransferase system IIC component
MDKNRYEPPKSGFESLPREPGSIVKAVIAGLVTDIGGTALLDFVFGIVYGIVLASRDMPIEEMKKTMEHMDRFSGIGLFLLTLGMAISVLGGFVCARIANRPGYLPLGIQSAISVAYGTVMGADTYEWRVLLALNLLSLAAIFFGGWLYIRKHTPRS